MMDALSKRRDSPLQQRQRGEKIPRKDTGIRGTMHRMLVHQSCKETKKKKSRVEAEKAVTSKSKHDEQRTERRKRRVEVSVSEWHIQGERRLCRMVP